MVNCVDIQQRACYNLFDSRCGKNNLPRISDSKLLSNVYDSLYPNFNQFHHSDELLRRFMLFLRLK